MTGSISRLTTTAIFVVLVATAAGADPAKRDDQLRRDPQWPIGELSRDLGVTEAQFADCFAAIAPVPRGKRTSARKKRADAALLLHCLKRHNPEITHDELVAVMARYPRDAQSRKN